MGLEAVEIIMEVEETFGVIVSDEAAPQIRTVGQLHKYVLEYRHREKQQGCPTGRAFREIRRVLMDTASVPRRAIRPSTYLKALLPPHTRRRVWKSLQALVSGRLRDLCLPFRLGPIIAGVCVLGGALGAAMIMPHVGFGHAIVLAGTALFITLLLIFFITRPLAIGFPRGVVTVGDLTLAALPPGYDEAAKQQMTDEEVWEKSRKIVAEILGVKVEDITPSARFVEDLGAG